MIESLDVFHAAQRLVEKHGDGAPIEALKRAYACAARGDRDSAAFFQRIASGCHDLLNMNRGGSSLN